MEEKKTEMKANEEPKLKTLEDLDKEKENKLEKPVENNEDKEVSELDLLKLENEKLKTDNANLKAKYTKAVEVNNQLYQRLTSEQKPTASAIDTLLKKF